MIGSLQGIIDYRDTASVIISVGGVGYKVFIPGTVVTPVGDPIKVFTHTHVREDVLELYGFTDPSDLKVFEYLIGVSGVGCKTALGIFAVGSRKEIINAITGNDVNFFTSVPRLGKKNAQKIIIELKNKLGGKEDLDLSSAEAQESDEVILALKSFGFTPAEAREALKHVGQGASVSDQVRLALKYLGK